MARLTKREAEEYVFVHYGINRTTRKVESVYQTRGGSLVAWRNEVPIRHPLAGRSAVTECVVVFGLSDIFSVRVGMENSEWVKQKIAEMQAKAAADS